MGNEGYGDPLALMDRDRVMMGDFKMSFNERGFTLLEIIVVIAIIAILAGAIAPVVFSQISERRLNTVNEDMEQIAQAIRRFYQDTGRVPPVLAALIMNPVTLAVPPFSTYVQDTCGNPVNASLYPHWKGPYLTVQTYDANGLPLFLDPWGRSYIYEMDNDGDCTNINELNFNPVQSKIHVLIYSTGARGINITSKIGGIFAMNDDDGDGRQDEDPIGDPHDLNGNGNTTEAYDDDGDGRLDEDPPNTRESANFYRLVSLTVTTNEKVVVTTQRLDTLEEAIRQFYRDTNKMPPTLKALISLNVTGVNPSDYPGWDGPYISGTPDVTNPNFLDGWGNIITMLVWVDKNSYGLPPHPFTFTDATRNDPSHPLGRYQAVLISKGADLKFTFGGSGTSNSGVEVDNDGDGLLGEDDVNGVDDDGDGLIDEDPPGAYEGPLDLPGTNDQDAPDPFRLISIRDIIAEKRAQTHKTLQALNNAAAAYNGDIYNNGVDEDENGIGSGGPDPGEGFVVLDHKEDPSFGGHEGGAFDHLNSVGYVSSSFKKDAWGNVILWDGATDRFYSAGPDGDKTTLDNVF